jgi:uncharacterized protein (DUF433 family)
MLNIGWQIADIACHFKATNEQVIAAICEYIREQREESRRLRRQASLRKKRVK